MLSWNGSNAVSRVGASPSAYHRVAAEEVPQMTFKGYQSIANLEPETVELIGLSQEYPLRVYDTPWKLFEAPDKKHGSQQLLNLALYKHVDPDVGRISYLVKSARDLKKNTALCFIGGQLMEEWKTEAHLVDSECYPMRSQELHDYFEYPRDGPNLVLQMGHYFNVSKYIRDPSFRVRGEGPNVATDLILHPKAKVVVLVLYTLEDIPRDEEVFCARFVGSSKKSIHQNMVLAARVSHFYHRYARRLEAAAMAANLPLDAIHLAAQQSAARKRACKLLTPKEQRAHMRGVDPKQKSVPIPPPGSADEHQAVRQRLIAQQQRDRLQAASAERLQAFFKRTLALQLSSSPDGADQFADRHAQKRHIDERWNALTDDERATWSKRMEQEKKEKKSGKTTEKTVDADANAADTLSPTPATSSAAAASHSTDAADEIATSAPPASSSDRHVSLSPLSSTISSLTLAGAKSDGSPTPSADDAASSSAADAAAAATSDSALGYAANDGQSSTQIEHDLMRLMDTNAAFHHSGCQQISRSTLGSSVTQQTRIAMLGIESPQYPDVVIIDGEKYPFDKVEMDHLLSGSVGYRPEKLEVREILSLASPCRYFCPPWYRSFCVVSKVPLKKGELLVIYSGEMEQTVQHRCSSYVYNLPTREGVSHFGRKYAAIPDLMIDAAAKGNIGRFINDSMFRNGEYQDESAANIGVTWVYDSCPNLVFYAKKDIGAGEELISSYGQEFWDVMCKQSIRGHSAFFSYIRPYTSSLEKLLSTSGVSVPSKPDVVIEREPLFEPKYHSYDPPPEDSDDEDEDEEEEKKRKNKKKSKSGSSSSAAAAAAAAESPLVEEEPSEFTVERIIGKKFLKDGSVRYLVKWLCYDDPGDNTWEPLAHLDESQESLSAFENKLRRLGLQVGEEPLPDPPSEDEDASDDDMDVTLPTSAPVSSVEDAKKQKKKKKSSWRNVPQKKVARKDLTSAQIAAASIDLTQDDEKSTDGTLYDDHATAGFASVDPDLELRHLLSSTSQKGRKRLPTTISIESDDSSPPAKKRPHRKQQPQPSSANSTVSGPPHAPSPAVTTDSSDGGGGSSNDDSAAASPITTKTKSSQVPLTSFFTKPKH